MVRRVFIAWSHALFHHSVSLLLNNPHVQIVGASQDTKNVQTELEALHPDTIIVELSEEQSISSVWRWIETSQWNPHIVCVSLHDNSVSIYHREQHVLEEAGDLLHLILNV
jgi:DNA-binding NarL/FixJ family response regulator